jgi:peptidoglycan/xylan/chitin deacetylase (PgdA/CDA1 family)
MKPSRYGPFPYSPITERPRYVLPGGARVAVWVIPNVEFFGLDDPMPGNQNERIPREAAKIPMVRNWAQREYGNRVGVWRVMEVLDRHGIRGTVALNSDICDYQPQIIEAAMKRGWEMMGHNQTNAIRLNEMPPDEEARSIRETLDRIERATGKRPEGWLSSGLSETWNTLDHLIDAGVRYVADWTCDDQPFLMDVGGRRLVSIPYSFELNDAPMFYYSKVSTDEFEQMIKRQFDVLYREGAESGRVMAICLHPFIIGVAHRIGALDRALGHIRAHSDVWFATGHEIVHHYLKEASCAG